MIALSDEQTKVRDAARRLATERIAPASAAYDQRDTFREDALILYREESLLAMYLPRAYGGLGFDLTTQCLVIEEFAKVCASSAVILQCQGTASHTLMIASSEEQRSTLFPRITKEGLLFSWCITESGAGSDSGSMKTVAQRDGPDYSLTGTKIFVTNGGYADLYLVFALTAPEKGKRGISGFLIEPSSPGFAIGRHEKKLGLRGSATTEVRLEQVRVSHNQRIGEEGDGFKIMMKTLDKSRPLIGAIALGIAEGALAYATSYAKTKEQFGQPIGNLQGIQFMLADMWTKIEATRFLLYQTTALHDAGVADLSHYSSMSKLFASDVAMRVTLDAVQILGEEGCLGDHPVERMMRDAKVTQIFEGTNEIQRLVIGRRLVGR